MLLLVACQPAAPLPVRLGALYPMTGDLADKGADSQSGVLLAIEDLNASGGIASLGNAPISLVTADTRGLPEVGAREAERLIVDERVVGLVGTYQSSVTKPATQVAEEPVGAGHARPQAPQFERLVRVSTQPPPQQVVPVGQVLVAVHPATQRFMLQ